MGPFAVAIIILTAVATLSLVFIALKKRRDATVRPATDPVHPQAPLYRQQTQHTEYYRPEPGKGTTATPAARAEKAGSTPDRLPHCPLCNAAVGFDDPKCPKCKHTLKDL